jgi:hypothetical protein
MRESVSSGVVAFAAVVKVIAFALLIAGLVWGVWVPVGLAVWERPLSILWWVPVGFILSGIASAIFLLVYNIIIAGPLVIAATLIRGPGRTTSPEPWE